MTVLALTLSYDCSCLKKHQSDLKHNCLLKWNSRMGMGKVAKVCVCVCVCVCGGAGGGVGGVITQDKSEHIWLAATFSM